MKARRGARMVGLMSGTSADGIDAVVAEIAEGRPRLRARVCSHVHQRFSPKLRNYVLQVSLHGGVAEICELNFLLGERFARAALEAISRAGLRTAEIDGIGSHGQTIQHLPRAKTPSTLQIGEPAVIAERTGITTVGDFRVRDMAAGGQGAPLVPFVDWALFTDAMAPRIVQNIGGIANLTFLPANATPRQVLAFDTGPGNMVIDAVVSHLSHGRLGFDRQGTWAAKGRSSAALLSTLMAHPFFRKPPPKTTGREEFGESFVREFLRRAARSRLSEADTVATATALIPASIGLAYERYVFPRLKSQRRKIQVILGGGGTRNRTLCRMLKERCRDVEWLSHDTFGIPNQAKEALAFAVLAHETLAGRPSNVPSATGARSPVVLGKIIPGSIRAHFPL